MESLTEMSAQQKLHLEFINSPEYQKYKKDISPRIILAICVAATTYLQLKNGVDSIIPSSIDLDVNKVIEILKEYDIDMFHDVKKSNIYAAVFSAGNPKVYHNGSTSSADNGFEIMSAGDDAINIIRKLL